MPKTTTYQKEAKNQKAVNQVTTWLKAAQIPVQRSKTPGCDLTAKAQDGQQIEIKVALGANDPKPTDAISVLASNVTHRNKAIAIKAFHDITNALGRGTPSPINRGVDPGKKLNFEDNFELVAMRHCEFRRVPNPDAAELKKYENVIMKAVARFQYINSKICKRHGLEFEDLKTYAQIWTCNFLGLYTVANPTNNDNEKKLYAHLCQRFFNFVEVLLKKERNCIPDPQTASVALLGRPYEPYNPHATGRRIYEFDLDGAPEEALGAIEKDELDAVGPELEFGISMAHDDVMNLLDEAAEEEREQKISDAKRRKLAQEALRKALEALPHDQMVETLATAMKNSHLCYDARVEARKQLRLHRQTCASCSQVEQETAPAQAGR